LAAHVMRKNNSCSRNISQYSVSLTIGTFDAKIGRMRVGLPNECLLGRIQAPVTSETASFEQSPEDYDIKSTPLTSVSHAISAS